MPYRPREIIDCLVHKFGFTQDNRDHKFLNLRLPGCPPVRTKVSHGRRQIPIAIQTLIARQLRVTNRYFQGMIDCTNDRDDYYRQVETAPPPSWLTG